MGWLNLPLYFLLPFLTAAIFQLWVLWKFLEEEHRYGARSRDSGRARTQTVSGASSLPAGGKDAGTLRPASSEDARGTRRRAA